MPAQHFADRLTAAIESKNTRVMVGLDPVFSKLPQPLKREAENRGEDGELWAIEEFCEQIVAATHDVCVAFKPQIAFFERYGSRGIAVLERILSNHRDKLFVVDCKRGDIGSTSEAYAEAYFSLPGNPPAPLECDAVTHNPYLGRDSIEPYWPYLQKDRGMFLLARTSNPGSADFQELLANDVPLAERVAEKVAFWADELVGDSGYSSLGLVVGATFPESAQIIRRIAPRCYFLVPGLATQGGKVDNARAFANEDGGGAIYNFSRAIIYAYAESFGKTHGHDQYAKAACAACEYYRDRLNEALG